MKMWMGFSDVDMESSLEHRRSEFSGRRAAINYIWGGGEERGNFTRKSKLGLSGRSAALSSVIVQEVATSA